jgi:hypothetical protein
MISCGACEKFTWNGNQIYRPSYQFYSEYIKQNALSFRILDVKTTILYYVLEDRDYKLSTLGTWYLVLIIFLNVRFLVDISITNYSFNLESEL